MSVTKDALRLRAIRQNTPGWSTAKNKKWQEKNPEKRIAHKKLERAINAGGIVRQPCERCGATSNVHAHHDDYRLPLVVNWLCQSHHRERHRELKALSSH